MTIYSKLNDILSSFFNLKNALSPQNFSVRPVYEGGLVSPSAYVLSYERV